MIHAYSSALANRPPFLQIIYVCLLHMCISFVYCNIIKGYVLIYTVAGNPAGIKIHAAFVSKATGEKLKTYAGSGVKVWMLASYESSAWSIMAISFISLLAMSGLLATCFFVRRHRVRRERPQARVREFHGMSSRLVKAMPSLIFTAVTEENCTASTCAICLEDYIIGDKLRVLPCRHSKLFLQRYYLLWLCVFGMGSLLTLVLS